MVWYYVKDGARQGPVEEGEFNRLVGQAIVRPDTLVWCEGMSDWRPYSTIAPGGAALYSETKPSAPAAAPAPYTAAETRVEPSAAPAPEPAPVTFAPVASTPVASTPISSTPIASTVDAPMPDTTAPVGVQPYYCSQCGRAYPSEELIRFGTAMVCANCKEFYAQRLRETGQVSGARVYGGFWICFVAVLIDGIALWIVNFAIQSVTGTRITNPSDLTNLALAMTSIGINFTISIALSLFYEAFFLVKFGATPGKMVFHLKVITPDGGPITWGRAIGRYFAKWLSSITLLIGYIMAGFDSEKRALHDYVAGTRVIRTA